MGKTVLVTGAAGFLGHQLVVNLIARGDTVVGVDTSESTYIHKNYNFIQGSVADFELINKLTIGVEEVYHLAARVPLVARDNDFLESNVLSPGIVAKCCALNRVPSLLLVSSSAVYGLGRGKELAEEEEPKPFEKYGKSKLAGEVNARASLGGITKLVILRPRTILGPSRLGIFATLFEWVEKGVGVPVFGKVGYKLQFVGVQDMVDAMLLAQEKGNGIYNVGARTYNSLHNELNTLIKKNVSSSRLIKFPRTFIYLLKLAYFVKLSPFTPWHVEGYARSLTISTDKLYALGWRPKDSTESIIAENFEWYKSSQDSGLSPHQKKLDFPLIKFVSRILR